MIRDTLRGHYNREILVGHPAVSGNIFSTFDFKSNISDAHKLVLGRL